MILESDSQYCSEDMLFTSKALKITWLKITQAKWSFVNVETGSHELVILSYATVCLHPAMSLNNEKNCRAISKDRIAVCGSTEWELFGFGFSVLESASSRRNISVLRHALRKSFSRYFSRAQHTAYYLKPTQSLVKNFNLKYSGYYYVWDN